MVRRHPHADRVPPPGRDVRDVGRLRKHEALRETLAALTPEFLNLLFQRQERLGEAQLQEFGASVTYNVAIAQLERSTGTGLEKRGIDVVVVAPDESPESALVPDGRFGTVPVGE